MHSSRKQKFNSSLEDVGITNPAFQADYDPEPDYDDDNESIAMPESSRMQPPQMYDQVWEPPRHPPEAFNEMLPWDPSMDHDQQMGTDDMDAYKNDPRLVLGVGQFLEEGHEEPVKQPQQERTHPREHQQRLRNSPRQKRRHPRDSPPRTRKQHQDPRDVPKWLTQPEVFDMSPRRRSSGVSNHAFDPLRRRRSSGRVGMGDPNTRRRSSVFGDANFDDLNDRRRSSAQRMGLNRNTQHLVSPRRDSVYSVGSNIERIPIDSGEDPNYQPEFARDDTSRHRLDSESTSHYTMRDVVKMAQALHLMDDTSEDQPLAPAEERPQELDGEAPEGFNKTVKRQCWTRYCQSQTYHAHAMRRTGGVTSETDSRERLQSHYGRHVTSKASWHMNQTKTWVRFKEKIGEIVSSLAVWHHSLKHIEGHFGTSIASYFIFIRWLFLLNIIIFIIMFGFIVVPFILKDIVKDINSINVYDNKSSSCSSNYKEKDKNKTTADEFITDFLQGTGWMAKTAMFIGTYDAITLEVNGIKYDLPLAYILATLAVLLLSLIIMLRTTAKGFKESAITSEGQLYNYCNTVFGGWDFCINRPEAAKLKHEMLTTELISCLEDEKRKRAQQNRTRKEKVILYTIRIGIWLIILSMLTGSGVGILEASNWSLNQTTDSSNEHEQDTGEKFHALFVEYLPTMVITALNVALPLVFYVLVDFEKYSPVTVVKVNLFRTLLLRLASIGVLLFSFQRQIKENNSCSNNCPPDGEEFCGNILCWETYVGQQLYKLVLLDFVVILVLTFGVNLLRMVLTTKLDWKIFNWLGQEQFDIPKHVLDLVYSQTLCWLGTFFSPLLPAACVIKCLLMFYIKKFHLFVNCIPSRQPYRASKSNAVFITVLLVSFGLFALIPFVYTIAEFEPSKSCGPFRTKHNMWQVVEEISWPGGFQEIITIIGSSLFAVPVVILLLLIIYYYHTIAASYKNMSIVLKDHLMMEGQDKQFLLERLNDVTIRMLGSQSSHPKPATSIAQHPKHIEQYKGNSHNMETAYF